MQQNLQKFNFRHVGEGDNLVTNLDMSYDGLYLLSADQEAFGLWDVVSDERVKQYKVGIRPEAKMPTAMVYGVDYLDEQLMISLSSSGYAEVWNLPTP